MLTEPSQSQTGHKNIESKGQVWRVWARRTKKKKEEVWAAEHTSGRPARELYLAKLVGDVVAIECLG